MPQNRCTTVLRIFLFKNKYRVNNVCMKGFEHMKNRFKRLEISILVGLIITISFSILTFAADCDEIRSNMLRMHVIANSDTQADQELKLKVRDAVLEAGRTYFDGSVNAQQAETILLPHVKELEDAAHKVITENGYSYDVKVVIDKEYFSTRTYNEEITLPAGQYQAVKVIIGEGKGHNWWCVMFPPMCLPAAENDTEIDEVLTDSEEKIVKSDPKFEPRFKIIEIYEKFADKIK